MELEFNTQELHDYNVGDHLEFHKSMLLIFLKYGIAINDPELLADYQKIVIEEEKSFKLGLRSEFTEKKAIIDYKRDRGLTGLGSMLRAATKHFDPEISDNAKYVLILFKSYGNLVNADYDAETAGIDSLIARLNSSDYAHAVQVLGLAPWIAELEKYNNLFKSYAAETELEQVKKPTISAKAIRKATDEAMRKITKRVTSLINLNGPDEYVPLVTEFNIHVDHYNNLVHERHGRLHVKIDISDAEIDPVAVQSYTGKPVHVIPVVKLRKEEKDGSVTIVELVFSEDFSVGYKNNINLGTAKLIITGIGKYKGEVVTTFNIAANDE
jgi:hypothetical protein